MKLLIASFVAQLAFIFLRTINIQQVANDQLFKSLFSGLLLSILYIYTTMLGVNALNDGDIPAIVGYLTGGIIGATLGMRYKQIASYLTKPIFQVSNTK